MICLAFGMATGWGVTVIADVVFNNSGPIPGYVFLMPIIAAIVALAWGVPRELERLRKRLRSPQGEEEANAAGIGQPVMAKPSHASAPNQNADAHREQ